MIYCEVNWKGMEQDLSEFTSNIYIQREKINYKLMKETEKETNEDKE